MTYKQWKRRIKAIVENGQPTCPSCLERFDPVRPGQVHCRPSCRALVAVRRRGADNLFDGGDDQAARAVVVEAEQ